MSGNPSGNRTPKRAAELFDELADGFGSELSSVDKVMLGHAAKLIARAEKARDPDVAVRLSNAAMRLLAPTRKRAAVAPQPPHQTFADIAARAQAEASQRRAQELADD